jgi:L-ascorbate metabolism protein UlaG (beta-lactamase superfamily)
MVVAGPTAVLDLGGLRIVSDPTFDAPGPHGYLTKTVGPAVADDQLGPVDLVLVSHDNHADNLDDRGRSFALAAPLVLTTRGGAGRLGRPAIGLAPWTSHTVRRRDGGELTVTAVPAVHGPEDGERDAEGFVNCEVIGFVLSGQDLPAVYVSGDNASIGTVTEIARRVPAIDAVVLHAGAARVQDKFRGRALSLDSVRAAAAAAILGPAAVIPAHYDGWAHFSEGRADLARAFDDAGLAARLRLSDHGTWIPLGTPQSEQIMGSGGYIWPGIGSLDPTFASYWKSQGLNVTPFETESKWNVVYWPVTPGMNQAQLDIANQLAPAYLTGKNIAQAVSAAASQANNDLASAG